MNPLPTGQACCQLGEARSPLPAAVPHASVCLEAVKQVVARALEVPEWIGQGMSYTLCKTSWAP